MNKFLVSFCGLIILCIVSCAPTPNEIVMSVNQGQCLTGGIDGAPMNNPRVAPYCMSVTLQNNNSGENANNVQVTTNGITLGYFAIANNGTVQSYSSPICDNNASGGVCPSGTGVSQIGNITIYDPNNCATQQGSKVNTLMAGGGTCTFYLQISAESFAAGSYPINITYNYTNSNQNYNISTTIFQNVRLYAGGLFSTYTMNKGTWESALNTANNVSTMIHDNYGNVYFNSGESVFQYNGLSTTQLGSNLSGKVNSLTLDSNNNLLAATQSGLYYYNISNSIAWSSLIDTKGVISNNTPTIGIATTESSNTNLIYVIESNIVFSCVESGAISPTLACTTITPSGTFNYYSNSIDAFNGSLYVGANSGFESYTNSWESFTINPALTGSSYVSSVFVNNNGAYFGISADALVSESSIYYCSAGGKSCVAESSNSGNYVVGNINALVLDGANNIYAIGNNINSADFNNSGVHGVYESGIGAIKWQPIVGNVESLSTLTVVSSLSSN
ncbi:MAG: hypothetical protein ACK5Z5_00695 [Neisseriaceae bacterium]